MVLRGHTVIMRILIKNKFPHCNGRWVDFLSCFWLTPAGWIALAHLLSLKCTPCSPLTLTAPCARIPCPWTLALPASLCQPGPHGGHFGLSHTTVFSFQPPSPAFSLLTLPPRMSQATIPSTHQLHAPIPCWGKSKSKESPKHRQSPILGAQESCHTSVDRCPSTSPGDMQSLNPQPSNLFSLASDNVEKIKAVRWEHRQLPFPDLSLLSRPHLRVRLALLVQSWCSPTFCPCVLLPSLGPLLSFIPFLAHFFPTFPSRKLFPHVLLLPILWTQSLKQMLPLPTPQPPAFNLKPTIVMFPSPLAMLSLSVPVVSKSPNTVTHFIPFLTHPLGRIWL